MATLEDLNNSDAEFAAAFNEEPQAPAELSEDEAFGIMPEQPDEDGASDGNSDDQGGNTAQAAVTLQPEDDPAVAEQNAVAGTPEAGERDEGEHVVEDHPSEADLQRQRSWEGRIRAREAQLAAREAELEARLAQANGGQQAIQRAEGGEVEDESLESQQHEAGESAETEAMENAAEQLESGKPVDAVLQSLRDDFGDDFVNAIQSLVKAQAAEIAEKMVGERVGDVNGALESMMASIKDRDERDHFQAIANAHPDFMEVANGEGMGAYLSSLPEQERAAAEQVLDGGTAQDVIALIEAVKGHGQPQQAAPQDDEALAAAEGVRSNGLKLPEKPAQSDDYEAAWADF